MATDKSTVSGQTKVKSVKTRRIAQSDLEKDAVITSSAQSDEVFGMLYYQGLESQLQGDFAAAQRFYEDALKLDEKHGPRDETVKLWDHLGFVLREQGFFTKAWIAYENALATLQTLRGPEGSAILAIEQKFAFLLSEQGDLERAKVIYARIAAAKDLYSRAHDIFQVKLDIASPIMDTSDARDLYRDSLQFRQQNDRNLKNEISTDELLIALKRRGISPNLVQRVAAELVGPTTGQLPEMTEQDLQRLAKQTKANPWSTEHSKLPSEFIALVYKDWLGKKRLMREQISTSGGEKLIAAYATEIHEHPERRLEDLGQRPHTRHGSLPNKLPKAPSNTWVPTSELSEEEKANRRLRDAKRKRDQRAKTKPKKTTPKKTKKVSSRARSPSL
jgi:tetratricopeptide (TPR) repeat protein